jgi:hypothetical protein
METAPGVSVKDVVTQTSAELIIPGTVPEMQL